MRKSSALTVAFACTALLAAQVLGLHFHVEDASQGSDVLTSHLQHHLSDRHDHESETDASSLELGNVWSKPLPLLMIGGSPPILVIAAAQSDSPLAARPEPLTRPLHWRPPMRAPPLPA